MKRAITTLQSVRQLTRDIFELVLTGDTSSIKAPGQFVNIELPAHFLRRPISVCDWDHDTLTLLVKAVGKGTIQLTESPIGTDFDVLLGLGNGFDMTFGGKAPLLVGGGIGAAPLYGLVRRMVAEGKKPTVVLGFRTGEDVYYVDKFRSLGCMVYIATEDGSVDTKGFVTDCMVAGDYVFACGPLPMLKAVYELPQLHGGQFSFEARMGCGFGACVGCTIPVVGGAKRVCKEGPIFYKEEIIW